MLSIVTFWLSDLPTSSTRTCMEPSDHSFKFDVVEISLPSSRSVCRILELTSLEIPFRYVVNPWMVRTASMTMSFREVTSMESELMVGLGDVEILSSDLGILPL